MPATIIVGGQFGSEGKGKVTALTASQMQNPWIVRCGGPNSGHSVWIRNQLHVLRQLPTSVDYGNSRFALAAGSVVDEELLIEEICLLGVDRQRVVIDPRAVLIGPEDRRYEESLMVQIGSTGSGTGSASSRRMMRSKDVRLVADSARLREFATIDTVAPRLHRALEDGEDVVVEGTQGFGLSLFHAAGYPYLTSKDTTASAFASEAGLAPHSIDHVTLVIRTFPIRVGGLSGDLPCEVTWDEVRQQSNAPETEPEFTSVTKRLRRVAKFDLELVKTACQYNCPTSLAVMGVDRLDYGNRGVHDRHDLTATAVRYLDHLWQTLRVPITWVGTGFMTDDALDYSASCLDTIHV